MQSTAGYHILNMRDLRLPHHRPRARRPPLEPLPTATPAELTSLPSPLPHHPGSTNFRHRTEKAIRVLSKISSNVVSFRHSITGCSRLSTALLQRGIEGMDIAQILARMCVPCSFSTDVVFLRSPTDLGQSCGVVVCRASSDVIGVGPMGCRQRDRGLRLETAASLGATS